MYIIDHRITSAVPSGDKSWAGPQVVIPSFVSLLSSVLGGGVQIVKCVQKIYISIF